MNKKQVITGVGVVLAIGLLVIVVGVASALRADAPPTLSPPLQAELTTWLQDNGLDPAAYVVGQFDDHDVVFLGESHRIKHDVLFVQSLLKPLHDRGVRVLATEFGRRRDQADIDALLTAPAWDEALAQEITFRQFVWWGYREYIDIYRAAWQLNRDLPAGAALLRILGINNSPDWSFIETQADRDNGQIKRKVWRGETERDWAQPILDAVAAGEKVAVYCGINHGLTSYRQPIVVDGEFIRFDRSLRCGNHVHSALGDRAMTVFLHSPWHGDDGYSDRMRHPAGGAIDALMAAIGPRPVGFDLAGGPFGDLRINDAVYRHGYGDFKLADFCDGWIYIKPISQFEGVTPIAGWINAANLSHAQAQSPNPAFRDAGCEEFNAAIAQDANMPLRWGKRLK